MERREGCNETPSLLAARANGELDAHRSRRLESHLGSCLRCQAAELRAARAERAFATVIGGGLVLGALGEAATGADPILAPTPAESAPTLVGPLQPAAPVEPFAAVAPATEAATPGAGGSLAPARGRSRRPRLVAAAIVGAALVILAAVLVLPGGASKAPRSTVRASAARGASATVGAPSATGGAPAPIVVPIPRTRPATHHAAAASHHRARNAAKPAASATLRSTATPAPAPVASAPVAPPPSTTTTPSVPAPPAPSPKRSGSVSMIQQPRSLPPKSAPTRGIGSSPAGP